MYTGHEIYESDTGMWVTPEWCHAECASDYDIIREYREYFAAFLSMHRSSPIQWAAPVVSQKVIGGRLCVLRDDEEADLVWYIYQALTDSEAFIDAARRIRELTGEEVSIFEQESEEKEFLAEWGRREQLTFAHSPRMPVTPCEHERED